MSRFIHGKEVNEAVSSVLRSRSVRCAVAFWGRGASRLFGSNVKTGRIICNLEAGATNPSELEKLMRPPFEVRQCDTLHAKVYIGDTSAIVTSANASANGLGLEGNEQHGWLEAGVVLDDVTSACGWFDQLWEDKTLVREITTPDLKRAHAKWLMRQRAKPSLPNFAAFDPEQDRPPLLIGYSNPGYELDEKNIRQQENLRNDAEIPKTISDRIHYGWDPENNNDLPVIKNRWILCWRMTHENAPDKRGGLYWTFLSDKVLKKAWYYKTDGKRRDVVLAAEEPPPEPFNLRDSKFLSLFSKLISEEKYRKLREQRTWRDIDKRVSEFWKILHERYVTNLAT